jgi:molybdenum cofactor cytidylyltransferase
MYNPRMDLNLKRALRIDGSICVAFIGSGGKTTAIFQLARELKPPVIVTATSHLGAWQTSLADHHVIESPGSTGGFLQENTGVILVTGGLDGDRTKPVSAAALREIHELCSQHNTPMIIEADGSRQKPLKGWASHEPPIPEFADHIVQVVGLSGLGQALTEDIVHRPEIFASLSGLPQGVEITPEAVARALTHPQGAARNIPAGAKWTVLLNQADTSELQAAAQRMAPALLQRCHAVIIASVEKKLTYAAHERIAGVVLAAGASARFGSPKQLLDWQGEPFVRVVARRALEAGLSPVLIITGAQTAQIRSAVRGLDVRVVFNREWDSGQASSIKVAVSHLDPRPRFFPGGVVFLLADQPQVTTSVIQALISLHAQTLHPIIAPMVLDRRANPVLFDRSTLSDLFTLEGDVGGRGIFHKHHVEYLPWHDDSLLLDVDTPEHYQRLISDETL